MGGAVKRHVNDPTSTTRLAIVSAEEGNCGAGPARQIYGILRFDVFGEKARLEITERGFLNISKTEARLLADALLEWCQETP